MVVPLTSDPKPCAEAPSVLVVDDEPALLEGYLRALRRAGMDARGVGDGLSAHALLNQRSFDAIVSDISMPGMDGVQLLRAVRERDLDVPMVLMTGAPAVDTAAKAVEFGALRYLVKPFKMSVLIEAVQQAHKLHKLARLRREAVALLGTSDRQLGDLTALASSFDRALERLWMAYQPIVSWSGHDVFAFEALMRSDEPTLPNPGAMIGAAERLGRLPELGRLIRDKVAAIVSEAPCELLFVNLHPHDLLDEALFSSTAPLSGVAERVVLEITERAALDEVPDARGRVARLRSLGYRIAIDDLGAGYAGLSSFAQLEPEVVKFDMSLLRALHKAPVQRRLVTSMAGLFREMGLLVVAEGVETKEECAAIVEAGCNLLQGYLFAKPGKPFPLTVW